MNYSASYLTNVVEITLAVQVIIATVELLKLRRAYSDAGLFAWQIQRTGPQLSIYAKKLRLDFVCRYPNVVVVLVLRLLSAIAIPILIWLHYSTLIPLLMVAAINLIMQVRNSQSNDGSDQMSAVCFIALALAAVINTELSKSFALFFIAAQAALAYGTSGFLKMMKKGWYTGEYPIEVLKTASYGDRQVLAITLKRKLLAQAFGLMVVFGDCLLSLSFAFPPGICIYILGFGVFLHIGIGRVMGLNTFMWSYIATYPAILFTSHAIYSLL